MDLFPMILIKNKTKSKFLNFWKIMNISKIITSLEALIFPQYLFEEFKGRRKNLIWFV